ncbi:F-box 7 [Micractinium conductrix]|uniref:F-box 7 n=1 Tax=Micractinium conductrix TaxID=554055 RepID=A0A2P6V4N3_9CHLO|nr:F-box 7 [Micractinium conductrix]|eukprot:PSC69046.1 F-box 7 [Micractinium conductrix]
MATAAVLSVTHTGGEGSGTSAYSNASGHGWLECYRPWMAMYGVRLQHGAQKAKQVELSLIEKLLPEEMLLYVLQFLPIHGLAAAQIVCRQWRSVGGSPSLWRAACMDAFFTSTVEQNEDLVRRQYRGCWKRMLLERPHLRFDGVYVSRNTYLRQGIVEWKVKNAVHLVLYYRYMRFYPDGTFAYRTSPEPLARVHRSLAQAYAARRGGGGAAARRDAAVDVYLGRFKQEGERVFTALRYLAHSATEIRSRLRLRSTVPGANNRLDIQAIVSWDRADGQAVPMMDLQPDEEAAEGANEQQHRRGMQPFVFVPFEQFNCHAINLPISEMDVFLPG